MAIISSDKPPSVKTMSSEKDAKKHRFCPMAESSTNNGSSPVTTIPEDHLFSILLLLPVESILSFAATCKKLKTLSCSDSLWESICRRDWGQTSFDALKGSSYGQQTSWKELYQRVYELDSVVCRRLLADADGDLPSPRASHSLNLVSGCLVLFGGGCEGGRHLDDTWIAHTGNDSRTTLKWQKMNSGRPSGRFGHSCVAVDEHLVLFGGINDLGIRQNDTWIGQVTIQENNTTTISWRLLDVRSAAPPPPRGAHAGCCMDNKRMLIHGGIGTSGLRLNDTWILQLSDNLHSGAWTEIVAQPSPPSRSGHTLTHIGGSQTVLFGGRGVGYDVLNDVWLLDASEDHWRWEELLFELRNVPRGLSLPRVGHSANLIIGRRLLIYGGEDSNRRRKDDFWILDINSMSCVRMQCPRNMKQNVVSRRMWRRLEPDGDKPECRSFHGACVDDTGRLLYVYGGMVDGLVQPADLSGLRFDGESYVVDLLHQP